LNESGLVEKLHVECRSAGRPITLKALTSAWSISATALLAICWDWGSLRVGRSISLLIALKGTSAFQDHLIVLLLGVKKVRNGTTDAISAMVGVMTMVRITIFRSTVALSHRYPMAPE
jgi:hypothetical protein